MNMRQTIWLAVGLTATGIGIVGIVVPLLPTTPLLLLSAFAYSRSSPRLHSWLVDHPHYGPFIRDWRRHRAIPLRAKVLALVAMLAALALSAAMGLPLWVLAVQAGVLVAAGAFILTRPLPPE